MKPSAKLTRNEAEDASKEKTAESKTSKANRAEGGETRRGERTGTAQDSKKTVKSQACKEDQRGKGTRAENVEGGWDKVSRRHRKTRDLRVGEANRAGKNKLGRKTADARRPESNNYDKDEVGKTWTGRTKAGEVETGKKTTKREIEEPSSPEVSRKATGPKPGCVKENPSGDKETGFAKFVQIGNSREIRGVGIARGANRSKRPNVHVF